MIRDTDKEFWEFCDTLLNPPSYSKKEKSTMNKIRKTRITLFMWFCFCIFFIFGLFPASALASNQHTEAEVKAWLDAEIKAAQRHGTGQCVPFVNDYLTGFWGSPKVSVTVAQDWYCTEGWYEFDVRGNADNFRIGDVVVENWGDGVGHVAIYYGKENGKHFVVDQNAKVDGVYRLYANKHQWWSPLSCNTKCFRHDFAVPEVRGSAMTQGYDRVLPDGDYLIATAGSNDKSTFYYLDILGTKQQADDGTNVDIWGPLSETPPSWDIWTIEYNESDKFYTIKQYGTNLCLDVSGADTLRGTNVWACAGNNTSAQKWAISRNGRNGYRLQAKCSGFSLDIDGGGDNISTAGTNVQQWTANDTDAQSWMFIPYKPSQPVAEGRYILLYTTNPSYQLDVSGDTGDVDNGVNVQIWADNAQSQYNSFDFIKLSDGYYKVLHAASGKCLDVSGGQSNYKTNVNLWNDNGTIAQQWAIVKNGTGYSLISKCNGCAVDLVNGTTINGQNVEVYSRLENDNQRWSFVKAEHSVKYNANGGVGAPASQIKYYKNNRSLSTIVPTRTGYTFLGWNNSATASEASFQPGDVYSTDADITLYAVWKRIENRISYDANGGTGEPADQIKQPDESIELSATVPTRAGYTFLGWASRPDAAVPEYQQGDHYSNDADLVLYAVWQITNPPTISGTNVSMLIGDTRDWHDFVTLTHDGVLSYTLNATLSGNAVSLDSAEQQVTAVSAGTAVLTVSAAEYPAASCSITIQVKDLGSMTTLPASVTSIEEEAFAGSGITAVMIPDGCRSIGKRAFAENRGLVFARIPSTVTAIADDAFINCPGLVIYCYEGSAAHNHAVNNGIHFTLITNDWVKEGDLPAGASVTDEKWTFTRTTRETTTSTASSMSGWVQDGYTWQKTGTGTYLYGSFPSGFDSNNSFYTTYAKPAMASSASDNIKREVSSSSHCTYVYWHWCWQDIVNDSNRNVLINDFYGEDGGKNYIYFDAFETTTALSQEGMTSGGLKTYDGLYSTYHHPEYNLAEYASWWWFRVDIQKQTYTDYQKLFTYVKTTMEECESANAVTESDTISDVQHWVKYSF